MRNASYSVLLVAVVISMVLGTAMLATPPAAQASVASQTNLHLAPEAAPLAAAETSVIAPTEVATITILHTNDFHGNLQLSGSNPGIGPRRLQDRRSSHRRRR